MGEPNGTPVLTPAQIETFTLLAAGYTPQQIAARLHIKCQAVWARCSRAARRLGARTTIEAVLLADRRGLLPGSALSLFLLDESPQP